MNARLEAILNAAGIKLFTRVWKAVMGVIAAIVFIVTTAFALYTLIDGLIEKNIGKKLNDEVVLRRIAAQSRPSLVFNAKEAIITDMGAAQFLNDIRITQRTKDGWPLVVEIDFKRKFTIPPILTALYDSVQITSEPSRLFAWRFQIHWSVEPLTKDDTDRLYRLELLP